MSLLQEVLKEAFTSKFVQNVTHSLLGNKNLLLQEVELRNLIKNSASNKFIDYLDKLVKNLNTSKSDNFNFYILLLFDFFCFIIKNVI